MMEERAKLEERVRQEVNAPKNASLLQDILEKMGRVLAKKRGLNAEKPRLVYDDRLWLGNFAFANDKNFLKQQEISAVISCLEVAPGQKVQGIEYMECYLKDGQDARFESVLEDFNRIVQKSKGNIYVHCFSGKSRSVALVLSLFMRHKKLGFDQACERLAQVYPVVQPNHYFQKILRSKQEAFLKEEPEIQIDLLGHNEVDPYVPEANNDNLLDISETVKNISQKSSPKTSPKKETINLLGQEQPEVINLLEVMQHPIQNTSFDDNIFFANPAEAKTEQTQQKSHDLIEIGQTNSKKQIQTNSDLLEMIGVKTQTHELLGEVTSTPIVVQSPSENLIGFEDNQQVAEKVQQKLETVDLLTDQPTEIIYSKMLETTKIEVSSYLETEASEPTQTFQGIPSEKAREQKPSEAKVEVAQEDEIVEKGDFTQKKRKPKKKKR